MAENAETPLEVRTTAVRTEMKMPGAEETPSFDTERIESYWVNNFGDFLHVTLPNLMACLIIVVQLVGFVRELPSDNQIMTMLTGGAMAHLFQQAMQRRP